MSRDNCYVISDSDEVTQRNQSRGPTILFIVSFHAAIIGFGGLVLV